MTEQRHLHLLGALGSPRTEMWQGREHLVVPMVALMEGVIHAVNAKTAEYVSAEALTRSADKWNGHPIVIGHPVRDGKQCSANDPAILERHGCGFIRQASMNGKRLGMEALIDPARLVALKHDQLLADLRAGKDVPVSVGAFVTTNDKKSSYNGKPYDGEWMEIGPDHTALLPGGVGACSLEMGCGANRAAMRVLSDSFEVLQPPKKGSMTLKDLKAKMLALFDTPEQLQSEEAAERVKYDAMRATCDALYESYKELDALIDELIKYNASGNEEAETELEAARLDAIRMHAMQMSGAVSALISTAYPMPTEVPSTRYMEEFKALYGKTISKATAAQIQKAHDASHDMHSHTVALGAVCNGMKLLEGERMLKGGPAICTACAGTGQIKTDDKQADCEVCDGTGNLKTAEDGNLAVEGDVTMTPEMKAAALKTLTACGCKKTFETDDQIITALAENAVVQTAEIVRLKALAECKTCKGEGKAFGKECPDCKGTGELKAAEIATALVASEAALRAAQAAQIPAEELNTLRALGEERKAKDAAEKAALVAQLTPLKTLTVEQLTARSLDDLRTLAAFAKVEPAVDYSGRGIAVPRQAETNASYTPPDPYEAGIKALQGAKVN